MTFISTFDKLVIFFLYNSLPPPLCQNVITTGTPKCKEALVRPDHCCPKIELIHSCPSSTHARKSPPKASALLPTQQSDPICSVQNAFSCYATKNVRQEMTHLRSSKLCSSANLVHDPFLRCKGRRCEGKEFLKFSYSLTVPTIETSETADTLPPSHTSPSSCGVMRQFLLAARTGGSASRSFQATPVLVLTDRVKTLSSDTRSNNPCPQF